MSFDASEEEGSIGARFLRVAELFPDHAAVYALGRETTYRELAGRAGAIARQLLDMTGPDWGTTAICCQDPHAWAAAMLGALLANKSVSVLDNQQPAAHMGRLLDDLTPVALLHDATWQTHALSAAAAQQGAQTRLCAISQDACAPPRLAIGPDTIALIVHTSGSTGNPKGVMRDHRMMLHRSRGELATGHVIHGKSRGTNFGSSAFSAAQNGLLANLLNGGCQCIYDFEKQGLHGISEWLRSQRLTYVCMMVGMARQWLALNPDPTHAPDLRVFQFTGAPASKRDAQQLQRHLGRTVRVSGTYSSTETATNTYWQGDADTVDQLTSESLPLGGPTDDRSILVLDEAQQPLNPGATGEIAIRSRYLARGYWRADAHTAEVFLTDPCDPQVRTFRTGDFGRTNTSGMLEILGRVDALVKVRGFRVNTNDIEKQLLRVPGVQNAVVLAQPRDDGDNDLIAHVVTAPNSTIDARFLRVVLERELPRYLHPKHMVMSAGFPMLANGKVDRRALAAIRPESIVHTAGVPPKTKTERMLGRLWQLALKLPSADVHQTFAEAGGDSFAAAVLESLLTKELAGKGDAEHVLRQPTIAHQAVALDRVLAGKEADASSRAPVLLSPGDPLRLPIFVVPMVDGGVLTWKPLADLIDHPTYALRLPLLEELGKVASFAALAPDLANDILRLQPRGAITVIGSCRMGRLALEICDVLHAQGREIRFAGLIDTPFDGKIQRRQMARAWRPWLMLALRTLARETRIAGIGPALGSISRTLRDITRRVTHPIAQRFSARQQAYMTRTLELNAAFEPRRFDFPVWFLKGGWSQYNLAYAGQTQAMGWDVWLPKLTLSVIPGTHSSMYEGTALHAFARELQMTLSKQ